MHSFVGSVCRSPLAAAASRRAICGTSQPRARRCSRSHAPQDIALAAALRIGDVEGQASAHRGIGCARIELGAFDDAHRHLAEALRLYRQSGDWNGQARIQEDLSRAFSRQGRHAEALRHGQEALTAFRAIGDRVGEAAALSNPGWDLSQVGDYVQALAYCEEALLDQVRHPDAAAVRARLAALSTMS